MIFDNRYCDLEPLRDGDECSKNRRKGDDRSRGKQGEASTLKKEHERSNHAKSKQSVNQFADELNATAMAEQCHEASKDNERDEVMSSVTSKLAALSDELAQAKQSLTECETRLSELTSQRVQLDAEVSQLESEQQAMDQEIARIDSQMISGMCNSLAIS